MRWKPLTAGYRQMSFDRAISLHFARRSARGSEVDPLMSRWLVTMNISTDEEGY